MRIAWLYGAPPNGAGALSVRMISFSAMLDSFGGLGREAAPSGIFAR